jgi:hypothetical protein
MAGTLSWRCDGTRYLPGFFLGSEGDEGEHLRDASGWPYSIYRRGCEAGVGDFVLAHGIQSLDDARALLVLLNEREGIVT